MNQLIFGDCLEEMDKLIENGTVVDAIICDPPYGTTACSWDSVIPFEPMWERILKLIKIDGAIVLHGTEPFSSLLRVSKLDLFRYDWVWQSNRAVNFAQAPYMPLKDTELISVFSKGTIAENSKNRIVYYPQGLVDVHIKKAGKTATAHRAGHKPQEDYIQTKTNYPRQLLIYDKPAKPIYSTQKPVKLMEYLIKTYTKEKETVLDFTSGSFTTMISCMNTNRNCIGIENDPDIFKTGKERVINHIVDVYNQESVKPKEQSEGLFKF